ncbi:MAG: hypothetical protein IKZ07_01430 [Akkermansia sp.]|nr:hypothetical protein [Akkermansia sp.]
MRRVRSKLQDSATPVVALAGINLVLLLGLCVLLNTHRLPKYGLNICPAESHFVLSRYDRNFSHVITITPGERPRLYLEGTEITGGVQGLEPLLQSWEDGHPGRVSVILVCDVAVPVGIVQQIADQVLLHGYNFSLSARPSAK